MSDKVATARRQPEGLDFEFKAFVAPKGEGKAIEISERAHFLPGIWSHHRVYDRALRVYGRALFDSPGIWSRFVGFN